MKVTPATALCLFALSVFTCSLRHASAAATDPYISEFMAENNGGAGTGLGTLGMDEFGTKPDWIEIHNPGAASVNLLNYFLTDDKLDPRKWAFPSYVLAAGARVVVYADNRNLTNPTPPNRLHTNFKLSSDGEYLALTRAESATSTMTTLSSFDPYPMQFRDLSYGIPSTGGAATYLLSPTPGAANSSAKTNVGPLIYDPTTQPPRPLGTAASPPMLITALVKPSLRPLVANNPVTIAYKVMFNSETTQQMNDNGANGDVLAGDGIYSALIPTATVGYGQMIRWRIIATDNAGIVSTSPPFPIATDSEQYYGTVAQDPSIVSQLPVVHWFVLDTANSTTSTGTRCSMFYKDRFYDNFFCSIHGQSTQGFPKKSIGFNFNADNSCDFWDNVKSVKGVNMLSNYADKSKVRNTMAYELIRNSGSNGHLMMPVRLQRNAAFYEIADACEQGDENYIDRLGLDPDGAFYKMYNTFNSATSGIEKKTRTSEPNDDLNAIITNLDETNIPLDTRRKYAYDNIDIPQTISYMVGLALVSSQDHGHKNYYVYRDTNASGDWRLLPWDVDLSLGRNWTGQYFDDTMYSQNVLSFSANNGGTNRYYNLFHKTPEFQKMYMRRLRTVMDQLLQPPSTAPGTGLIETRIKQLLDQMDPSGMATTSDAYLDWNKWLVPAGGWGGNMDNMRQSAQRLMDQHVCGINLTTLGTPNSPGPGRRSFLYNSGPTLNGEPIPSGQTSNPTITIEGYDSNPSSGIQDAEYITLKNPSTTISADISGWKIDGGIRFTFRPGTVIPPGGGTTQNIGLLFVAKSQKAFRARTTGPGANQYCYVTGPYDGQLSGRGETISLLDAAGNVVATKVITPNPSPAQLNLRITELNYAPLPPTSAELASIPTVLASDFEYLEVTNFGASTLDISGATISKGIDFTFPAGTTLAPGGRTLVVGNINAFRLRYGQAPTVAGQYWGDLDNSGETLLLVDKVGEKVEEFTYDGAWHPLTNLGGYTMVARNPNPNLSGTPYDSYSLPTSWAVSGLKGGTPGAADPFYSMTYASWLHDHFTIPEQLDDSLAGPNSNPEADLLTNWAEYQRGGDPRVSDTPTAATWQLVNDAGADYGAIKFIRRAHALDNTLVVEAAVDPAMTSWTATGTQFGTAVQQLNDLEQVVFRDNIPLSQAKRVLRVRDTVSGSYWLALVPQSINFPAMSDIPYPFTPINLNVTADSGLAVNLTLLSGNATLTGNSLKINEPSTISISAKQPGNQGYLPATEVIRTFNVTQLDQLLDFPAISDTPFSNTPLTLAATVNSGLPITFTLITGPGTITGDSLQLTDTGTFTIEASQAGSVIYKPATTVQRIFQVLKGSQTIDFTSVGAKQYLDPAVTLSATATSGLPVTLNLVSGPGTLNGSILSINGAGNIVVEATQGGDSKFDPAATVSQTIAVSKAAVTVTWNKPADVVSGTALSATQLNATISPSVPGAFVYTPPAGTVLPPSEAFALAVEFVPNDGTNYANGTASTTIKVIDSGTIPKTPQTITFAPVGTKQYLDAPFALSATSSVGLPVTLKVLSGPGTLDGSKLTINGAGTIVVEASQSGSDTVEAAATVTRSIAVNKAPTTVTWDKPADVTGGTVLGPAQLNATAPVPGTFSYSPPAGTVLSRNDALQLSVIFTPTDSANYLSSAQNTTLKVTNSTPAIESAPTVSAQTVMAGSGPVTFAAKGSDGDNDTLTYTWDFGDGSTGTGASASHVYTTPGNYTARVTITDAQGQSVTSTVAVHVAREIIATKATVKLNFQKPNYDAITLSGSLQLPAGTLAGGKTVRVSIGDQDEVVTLDAKGKGKSAHLAVSIAAPKNGASKYTVTWSKDTFPLETMGFVNETVKNASATLVWKIEIDGSPYQGSVPMSYTATKGKKGAGKPK